MLAAHPAEVEDALSKHEAIESVVVVPVADETWGEVGRAVVTLSPERATLSLDELDEFLAGRLAGYKHPRSLAVADAIPRTGPEKIDRGAVSDRFGDGST